RRSHHFAAPSHERTPKKRRLAAASAAWRAVVVKPKVERSVAVATRHAIPGTAAVAEVTIAVPPVVAAAATLRLPGGDGAGAGSGATAGRATDDGAGGAAQQSTSERVLRRRLLRRHDRGKRQQPRGRNGANHPQSPCYLHRAGTYGNGW